MYQLKLRRYKRKTCKCPILPSLPYWWNITCIFYTESAANNEVSLFYHTFQTLSITLSYFYWKMHYNNCYRYRANSLSMVNEANHLSFVLAMPLMLIVGESGEKWDTSRFFRLRDTIINYTINISWDPKQTTIKIFWRLQFCCGVD